MIIAFNHKRMDSLTIGLMTIVNRLLIQVDIYIRKMLIKVKELKGDGVALGASQHWPENGKQ
jgi:hypothetical protein